jgi:hypothetical protein
MFLFFYCLNTAVKYVYAAPVAVLLLETLEAAGVDSVFADAVISDAVFSVKLRFLSVPLLKSVSYQPFPLSRKPAAEISLVKVSC